jgi:hypothetical protein
VDFKKIWQKIILLFVFLMVGSAIHAQPVVADTTQTVSKEPTPEELHSPRKATLYSAILPGLGQAYNKKYWKIPFIYAGFGVIGYFIDWNNDNYQLSKTAYIHLTDTDPETMDYLKLKGIEGYDLNNPTSVANLEAGLLKRQDYYRRNRDFLVISMLGFYGLNLIDASVDAHLFNFDVGDDLTLNWQPSMKYFQNEPVYCINFTFNF